MLTPGRSASGEVQTRTASGDLPTSLRSVTYWHKVCGCDDDRNWNFIKVLTNFDAAILKSFS